MSRRPSLQWYPADWRNNANLRRCSWEARGVWIEIIGLMHDSDEYGILRWTIAEIAQALGAPPKSVQELTQKGVMKGANNPGTMCPALVYVPRSGRREGAPVILIPEQPGPLWYSSRLVRDEYVRGIRGDSNRFGDSPTGSPKPPRKPSPKPPFGEAEGDGSSTSTSSSVDTSPQDSTTVGPPIDLDHGTAYGVLAVQLRAIGIVVTEADPLLRAWIDELRLDRHRIHPFIVIARQAKPLPQRIPAKYLDTIIRNAHGTHSRSATVVGIPPAAQRRAAKIAELVGRPPDVRPDDDALPGTSERVG